MLNILFLCTLTGRCTPRPHSCSLTCASTVSHQVVACVTTVGGCLSKCCSRSEINLAISWVSQTATVHNCLKGEYTHTYHASTVSGITDYNDSMRHLTLCTQSTYLCNFFGLHKVDKNMHREHPHNCVLPEYYMRLLAPHENKQPSKISTHSGC